MALISQDFCLQQMDNSDLTLSSTSPDRVVIHLVVGNNKWL